MLKPELACLSAFAVLLSFWSIHPAAGQDCTPEFAIYSAESIEGSPASFEIVRIAVKNTGSCAGTATVSAEVPQDWLANTFTTEEIPPGDTDTSNSIKVIIPSGAVTSIVNFTAPGAKGGSTKMIIAGSPEVAGEPVQEQPVQQEPAPSLIINTTPAAPISPAAPAAQPAQESEPQAEQTSLPSTGLVSANPAAQVAVFGLLIFGAGYLLGKTKGDGFRYRFKRK